MQQQLFGLSEQSYVHRKYDSLVLRSCVLHTELNSNFTTRNLLLVPYTLLWYSVRKVKAFSKNTGIKLLGLTENFVIEAAQEFCVRHFPPAFRSSFFDYRNESRRRDVTL